MAYPNLTKAQIRRASRLLKAHGRKLPAAGRCIDISDREMIGNTRETVRAVAVCNDGRGYYLLNQYETPARRAAFSGHKRRSRR